MTFFIAVIADNLGSILGFLFLLAIYSLDSIAPDCDSDRAVFPRLFFKLLSSSLFLFFLLSFIRRLFSFRILLSQLDLIFSLRGLFVSLVVLRIEIHLQEIFFSRWIFPRIFILASVLLAIVIRSS